MNSDQIELVKKTIKSIAADLKADDRLNFLDWSQLAVEYISEYRSEVAKDVLWVYLIFQEDMLYKDEMLPEELQLRLNRTMNGLERKYMWDTFISPYVCRLCVADGTEHEALKKYVDHWAVLVSFRID